MHIMGSMDSFQLAVLALFAYRTASRLFLERSVHFRCRVERGDALSRQFRQENCPIVFLDRSTLQFPSCFRICKCPFAFEESTLLPSCVMITKLFVSSLLAARFIDSRRFLSSPKSKRSAIWLVVNGVGQVWVSSNSSIEFSICWSIFDNFLLRQAFEQYLTASQFLAKDFLQVNERPHDEQLFWGNFVLMVCSLS